MELDAPTRWKTLDFVSDLHLQDSCPRTLQGFVDYLDRTSADAVFVLGDLFEFWIGDDWIEDPQEAHRLCFEALARAGARLNLYIMRGNRDFLMGTRLMRACQAQDLPDPTTLVFAGQRIVLSHGDGLCTGDTRYQEFRQLSRSPAWQREFLSEPLAGRKNRMLGMRAQSEANKKTSTAFFDVDHRAALALLQARQSQTLVHGHTHMPDCHAISEQHVRWVLSDWDLDAATPRGHVLRLRAAPAGAASAPLRWERLLPADAT
ncbi:MAG: UDP-2,3-diacylglucosamine diphosphatase [Betaproteobacteria bacterium]|nr:UDP-2,3-diacylglucosamine diphosphatase [Betaproteobacteria bacterium]